MTPIKTLEVGGLEWTGERLIPGVQGDVALEHLHRYALARSLAEGKEVLDIACGEGYGAALLAQVAAQVTGVDISERAIQHARRKYASPNLRFETGICSRIPLPDASIDLVVSFETLEHVDDQDAMLGEIRRVLRPGGMAIISTPNKRNYSERTQYENPYHLKELYAGEFFNLLERYFAHHVLLGQRVCRGSLTAPLVGLDRRGFVSYQGSYDRVERDGGLRLPIYMIAVASDLPVEPLYASLYEGDAIVADIDQQLADCRRRLEQVEPRAAELEARLIDRQNRLAALSARLEERQTQLADRESQLVEGGARLAEAEERLAEAWARTERLRAEVHRLAHRLGEAQRRCAAQERHAANLLHELTQVMNARSVRFARLVRGALRNAKQVTLRAAHSVKEAGSAAARARGRMSRKVPPI
jgi:SAM-dependent methyltransferase